MLKLQCVNCKCMCLFVFFVVFTKWYFVLVRFVLIIIEYTVFVLCFEFVTIGK